MERGIDPIEDPDVAPVHRGAAGRARRATARRWRTSAGSTCATSARNSATPARWTRVLQEQVRRFDGAMLDRAAAGDPEGWFRTAGEVGNRWRVCGLAATYTFLHAIGPARGRLLKYEQALDDRRTCCVSFASMAFHASEPVPAVPAFDAHVQIATAASDRRRGPAVDRPEPAPATPLPGPRRFPRRGLALRRGGRGRALGRPALPDDLPHPRRRARRCS